MGRFFVEGRFAVGDVVALGAGDARKAIVVLRLRDGDVVEVIDSAAVAYAGPLTVAGDVARVRLERVVERAAESGLRLTLAQGVPKGQKMDFVVEKATELGVVALVPFFSQRSIGERVGVSKVERWRRIAKTAAQQSGRSVVPAVDEPLAFDALPARFSSFDRVLVAWEVAARVSLRDVLPSLITGAGSALVVIGPEGGLSQGEVDRMVAAGARVVSLGARILRTETAGLVACTALLYAAGEL